MFLMWFALFHGSFVFLDEGLFIFPLYSPLFFVCSGLFMMGKVSTIEWANPN